MLTFELHSKQKIYLILTLLLVFRVTFQLSNNSVTDLRSDPDEAAGQWGLKAALAHWEAGDTGRAKER